MKSDALPEKTVGAVMVVGGGIAGIQTAMDLADTGYYVYLVERSTAIGGIMAVDAGAETIKRQIVEAVDRFISDLQSAN